MSIRPLPVALAVIAAALLVTGPWWGRRVLRELAFFRVRQVRVVGTHYLSPRDVVAAMRVDTTMSTWDDLRPLAARIGARALVRHAEVKRELPGTLVVQVTEAVPVALAPTPDGLKVYDDRGAALPIDPATADVDLPVLDRPDALLARLLGGIETAAPALFARINAIHRRGHNDLIVRLDAGVVLAHADVTPARLADALPVAADLARRGVRFTELDLRYRDQVVARLE